MTFPGGELLYEPGVEPILTPKEIVDRLQHELAIARERREIDAEESIMMLLHEQYTIDPSSRPSARQ